MTRTIDNTADILDSRDVIARIEELTSERDGFVIGAPDGTETPAPEQWAEENPDESDELAALEKLADEASPYSDDWEYGSPLIRDSYFRDYAEELAEDIGAVNKDATWPNNFIDWESATDALKQDYTSVEFDGVTYWIC